MPPNDLFNLFPDLPVPIDDGAAAHLAGMSLPGIALPSTAGSSVDLSTVPGKLIVFAYPRTGRPDQLAVVSDWDMIPGARGCTPQTCGFRDLNQKFRELGFSIFGLSTQRSDYQKEMVERLGVPFPVLSDAELKFTKSLNLPTHQIAGLVLLKRLVLVIENGQILKVFYPVFPPDRNAAEVLEWARSVVEG